VALTEAEKEQVALWRVIEAKDAELAKARAELKAEQRARTNAEKLCGQLKEAQVDVKSFKRRLGVLKGNAKEARQEARKMSDPFQSLQEEQKKSKVEWKRIQTRLTADVEITTDENARLKQEVASLTVETTKLKNEKDGAVRCAQQF
jgi:chromosome segregation ATPase